MFVFAALASAGAVFLLVYDGYPLMKVYIVYATTPIIVIIVAFVIIWSKDFMVMW